MAQLDQERGYRTIQRECYRIGAVQKGCRRAATGSVAQHQARLVQHGADTAQRDRQ